jgi:hypothetical protein
MKFCQSEARSRWNTPILAGLQLHGGTTPSYSGWWAFRVNFNLNMWSKSQLANEVEVQLEVQLEVSPNLKPAREVPVLPVILLITPPSRASGVEVNLKSRIRVITQPQGTASPGALGWGRRLRVLQVVNYYIVVVLRVIGLGYYCLTDLDSESPRVRLLQVLL